VEESIVEESIAVSMSQSSTHFEELKKRQLKLVSDKRQTLDTFSNQVEEAIDREKESKEKALN